MAVRGRLAFDDQGRFVEIAEDAQDPTNPSESEIDPVEFAEIIADGISTESVSTEQAGIGGSEIAATADIALYLDGSTARAVDDSGVIAESTSHGQVWQSAIDALDPGDVLEVSPGSFDTSDVDPLTVGTGNSYEIRAYGADINSTFRNETKATSIYGLTVDGAIGNGFEFYRSQDATYHRIYAKNCGDNGFLLGDEPDAQVARSVFHQCFAHDNGQRGWHLDGDETNSFVNHNRFIGCDAKHNANVGWLTIGTANYNQFFGCLSESNVQDNGNTELDIRSEDTALYGCYAANGNTTRSVRLDPDSSNTVFFGGRYPQGIDETESEQWFGFTIDEFPRSRSYMERHSEGAGWYAQDLSGISGDMTEVRAHDGGDGNPAGLYEWDSANSQWVGVGVASGTTI